MLAGCWSKGGLGKLLDELCKTSLARLHGDDNIIFSSLNRVSSRT